MRTRSYEAAGALPQDPADPAWIAETPPDVQAVYRYWKAKCAGRRMPRRADLDPADLVRYLPSVMLVDVLPSERRLGKPSYVYRLAGTREVAVRGFDPTGKPVDSYCFGLSAEAALANYDQVVESRAPWIDPFEMLSADSTILDRETLFLPLSSDGIDVDMILVFSMQEKLVHSSEPL